MPDIDADVIDQLTELSRSGYALAVQLLRNGDDAADAVQDSLHTLLRKGRLFDPRRGQLRSWYLKIVRNRCLDTLRRRGRRPAEPIELAPAGPKHEQPEEVAQRREASEILRTQLMEMPPQQREIILLRDFHELSYSEVADVLSIPVGTVMSRLHRARAELRRRMQAYR